jgi:hypothetical protein
VERELRFNALYEFSNFVVLAMLRGSLLVCLLVCHAHSLPQTEQVDYLRRAAPFFP